jgi:putative two-component system response regulator
MAKILEHQKRPSVPPQALLLSLLSLWVPVVSSSVFPHWTSADVGVLIWLLALIPPFLLSYYRGWRGASLALAGGMAAFSLAQVMVTLAGAEPPPVEILLGLALVMIIVSLGSGAISSVLHASLDEAARMALTDSGTGLPNRRHGMLHLQRAFAAADRGAALSVVLFDLDRFKSVNDRFGHQTGDEVLRVFASILSSRTRAMNLAVRFGGEEFMAVMDGADADAAVTMAESVLAKLRSHEFPWGRITVSAGVSEYEPGMASPDVLVAAADQALYRAKARGGDQVTLLARQGVDTGATVEAGPGSRPIAAEGRGELVLIVDDDPAVLRTLARGLRRRRYQPLEATSPLHALAIARGLDEPIDLVIADIVMPEMSGFRLVEMLLEIQPELRALYISGYARDEIRWSGVPGAVKSFLPKPISLDALTSAVRSSLDAPVVKRAIAAPAEHVERAGGDSGHGRLQDRLAATSARMEETYTELLHRLAWAAEYRDDVTGRHAERVGTLAGLIARELGLGEAIVGRVEQAATLHDVGKIAVPDSVLNKPDALTPTEAEIMHRHCVVGAHLLAGSRHPLLQEAEKVARWHHERWDGNGYPDGLAGDSIPLAARITAVADTVDSMMDARPYSPASPLAVAVEAVRMGRGTQFDPAVADALVRLAERGELSRHHLDERAGRWLGEPPAAADVTGTGCRTEPV